MRNVKYRLQRNLMFDYKAVEGQLSRMAARGWRLEKVDSYFWKYRRAEPARVTYAVTYLEDASWYTPRLSGEQQDLDDLCAAAGWTRVADWYQMQIFCSEAEDPVPLETDEAVRLEAIDRSIQKGSVPYQILLLIVSIVLMAVTPALLARDPLATLSDAGLLLLPVCCLFLLLSPVTYLLCYRSWHRRSLRSVAQGGPCVSAVFARRLNRAITRGLGIFFALFLLLPFLTSANTGPAAYTALYSICIFLISFCINRTREVLRDRGTSTTANVILTLLVDVVLVALLILPLSYGRYFLGWFSNSGQTYSYDGRDWDVAPIDIPLSLEDLTGIPGGHINRRRSGASSFLMTHITYEERTYADALGGYLRYTVTASPFPRLHQLAMENYLSSAGDTGYRTRFGPILLDRHWETVQASPWQAEAAYQLYEDNGTPLQTFFLRYEDRMVKLELGGELTDTQKTAAAQKLRSIELS